VIRGPYGEAVLSDFGGPGRHRLVGLGPQLLVEGVHLAGLVVLQGFDDVEQDDLGLVGASQLTGGAEDRVIWTGEINRDEKDIVHRNEESEGKEGTPWDDEDPANTRGCIMAEAEQSVSLNLLPCRD
jgi:hypothetical protein